MGLANFSSKYLAYPLWALREGHLNLRELKSLERTEREPLPVKAERQWNRLKEFVRYAASHCPFYGSGEYSAIDSPDRFKELPVLTKKHIRAGKDSLLSAEFKKGSLLQAKTGGSTGISLQLHFDSRCQQFRNAAALRSDRWSGWDLGKRRGCLWGNPPLAKSLKQRIRNAFLDRLSYLDTVNLSDGSMNAFVSELKSERIEHLFGHAHSLYLLARFIEQNHVQKPSIKGIVSTSMMLLPAERQLIERVFECKVTDRYGCEEVGLIAAECEEHQGLHVNIDHLYVELLKRDGSPAGEGEEGQIVVTDLINHGMPLIRYAVGDIGIPTSKPCTCGRTLPLLKQVIGRTADFLITKSGGMVAGVSLVEKTLTAIRGLEQLQIVQNTSEDVLLNVVPDEDYDSRTEESLLREMRAALGEGIAITIHKSERIQQEANGKYRFAICRISSPYQEQATD